MEKIPTYLTWYLLKIRSHSGESSYLRRRFESLSPKEAVLEKQMLDELTKYRLIDVSDTEWIPLVSDTSTENSIESDVLDRGMSGTFIHSYPSFLIAPRGHYLIRESVIQFFCKSAWTVVVALLGVLVGLAMKN